MAKKTKSAVAKTAKAKVTFVPGTARQAKDAALASRDVTAPEEVPTKKDKDTSGTPKRTPLKFSDATAPGVEWTSNVPAGEKVPARIKISSRNSDGSYSYFCYRNAEAVAVRHELKDAMRACEIGKQSKLSDSVLAYVTDHPLEIPPFLALSEGERRAVREQYGYAAPAASRVAAAQERGVRRDAGDDSDPGTRALRAQLAREGSGAQGRAARAAEGAAPRPKKTALEAAEGRLVRAKDGNPKKPGTGAHKRWETLFAACGGTVAAYRDAGGNMETLANAVAKGHVRIEEANSETSKKS